jgi:hypothetical protein
MEKIKVDGRRQQVKKGELLQGLKGLVTGDDLTKIKEHLDGIGDHENIGFKVTEIEWAYEGKW